jgi:MFS family permease
MQLSASATKSLSQTEAITDLERETMKKVMWRLIPILILCYFAAFVDRTNVSFASLTMNKTLGFSSAVYGLGAGIFFWGYCLFEIPSNLILAKVGARLWIARILITWGIISGLTAFVWSPTSFFSARFLLGVAESGFYPGIILYLTWWFPKRYRAWGRSSRVRCCSLMECSACMATNGCSCSSLCRPSFLVSSSISRSPTRRRTRTG